MYFVYIARTPANTLYIGVTENPDRRIDAHNTGKGAEWIKTRRGARFVYLEAHPTLGSARKREIQLKKWSRAKKEALIAGNLTALKSLSRSKSTPATKSAIEEVTAMQYFGGPCRSHFTNRNLISRIPAGRGQSSRRIRKFGD
jgi:putative endonuclease